MPIRPEMQPLYPPKAEWGAIRNAVLWRAYSRCECKGQCGAGHPGGRCGIRNREWVCRSIDGPPRWIYVPAPGTHKGALDIPPGYRSTPIQVVLTIAHYPDKHPSNCDPANLLALCQLCHLRLDSDDHVRQAMETRANAAASATGQLTLFGEIA